MAATKTLDDLFLDTLKDIYFAEKQILKALPKMARAANSEEGKAGFLQHRDETQGQIERLEQVFELLGKAARGPAKPFRALLPRAKRSSRSSRSLRLWMQGSSHPPRQSSTTRSPVTAR
ncbi:hypothetical protein HNR26_004701 [Rhizobium rosettiformans]|uniref:DUF892 family protein n=1 Tax=Rhizobium rosettiformans TaxID=1368430 RepID=A0A7W8HUN9_9HYPH|nr:hypothetical protein [Rhizobium rosettiformans]